MAVALGVATLHSACGAPSVDLEALELGVAEQAVRGGTPTGHIGVVRINGGCTGSMIGRDLILTAAHCFDSGDTSANMRIEYFEPGGDPSSPREVYDDTADIHIHPKYNPAPAGDWESSNHDIALIHQRKQRNWSGTGHSDYLRIYQDLGSLLPSRLDLYGQGYETLSGNGFGTLRRGRFEVDDVKSFRIHYEHTNDLGSCKGDSGGPLLVPGYDLVACVESKGNHDGAYCGQDDGIADKSHSACARTVWENVGELIGERIGSRCTGFAPANYKYTRCFDLPLIHDVPNEGLSRTYAIAITATII